MPFFHLLQCVTTSAVLTAALVLPGVAQQRSRATAGFYHEERREDRGRLDQQRSYYRTPPAYNVPSPGYGPPPAYFNAAPLGWNWR